MQPFIDVELLKRHTEFSGLEPTAPHIGYFWQVQGYKQPPRLSIALRNTSRCVARVPQGNSESRGLFGCPNDTLSPILRCWKNGHRMSFADSSSLLGLRSVCPLRTQSSSEVRYITTTTTPPPAPLLCCAPPSHRAGKHPWEGQITLSMTLFVLLFSPTFSASSHSLQADNAFGC